MNSKHLRELLEQGHRVAIQDKETNAWRVIFYVVDSDYGISFYGTYTNKTIEGSLYDGFSKEADYISDIENDFTDDYKIVTPAPKLLEVGDEVEIVESFKDGLTACNISDGVYEIKRVCSETYEFSNHPCLPHRAVAKLPPKEEETIKIIDGKRYKLVE